MLMDELVREAEMKLTNEIEKALPFWEKKFRDEGKEVVEFSAITQILNNDAEVKGAMFELISNIQRRRKNQNNRGK